MSENTIRLTEADLQAQIADVQYQRFGQTCTVCALILKNGFVLIGKSACLRPEIFDEETGKNMALADAVKQMWELEGYAAEKQMIQEQEQEHG